MTEKLHVIDGVTYREVERKAKVGEKVIAIEDDCGYSIGDILTVIYADRWGDGDGISVKETSAGLFHFEYRVLEPVESAQPSEPLLDLIAKLTTRLMRLEDELDSVRRNVQTFAEQTESNTITLEMVSEALGGERQ